MVRVTWLNSGCVILALLFLEHHLFSTFLSSISYALGFALLTNVAARTLCHTEALIQAHTSEHQLFIYIETVRGFVKNEEELDLLDMRILPIEKIASYRQINEHTT